MASRTNRRLSRTTSRAVSQTASQANTLSTRVCKSKSPATPRASKSKSPSARPRASQCKSQSPTAIAAKLVAAIKAAEPAFPFMDLPAELRLNVYRYALSSAEPLTLHIPPAPKPDKDEERVHVDEFGDHYRTRSRSRSQSQGWAERLFSAAAARKEVEQNESEIERGRKRDIDWEGLAPALIATCKDVCREARPVLYGDNTMRLRLDSALHSVNALTQRNRSLIKHVCLTIPTHHDILESFADLVRLGLRYCWNLKTFTISLPYMFPEDRSVASTTNVYANAFHILRWLPKGCVVSLEGNVHREIQKVVADNGLLAQKLDDKAYSRRQHQMPEKP